MFVVGMNENKLNWIEMFQMIRSEGIKMIPVETDWNLWLLDWLIGTVNWWFNCFADSFASDWSDWSLLQFRSLSSGTNCHFLAIIGPSLRTPLGTPLWQRSSAIIDFVWRLNKNAPKLASRQNHQNHVPQVTRLPHMHMTVTRQKPERKQRRPKSERKQIEISFIDSVPVATHSGVSMSFQPIRNLNSFVFESLHFNHL